MCQAWGMLLFFFSMKSQNYDSNSIFLIYHRNEKSGSPSLNTFHEVKIFSQAMFIFLPIVIHWPSSTTSRPLNPFILYLDAVSFYIKSCAT